MDLFIASSTAVSTLATILVFGTVWGTYPRPHGVLTPAAVKTASTLVMFVFSPSLLLSTYSQNLTPEILQNIGIMCSWALIHIAVGFVVGNITVAAARPDANLKGVYRIALIWGNAASLPFLLLTTLVRRDKLASDAGAFGRGVAYVFSYLIPWWISIYSLGFDIMSAESQPAVVASPEEPALAPAPVPVPAAPPVQSYLLTVLQKTMQQPPVAATFVGLFFGLTPLGSLFFGPSAPLQGVGSVINLLGQGSIPTANIVLAGSLFSAVVELHKELLQWMGEAPLPASASGLAMLLSSLSLFKRACQRRWSSSLSSSSSAVVLVEEEEGSSSSSSSSAGGAASQTQATPVPQAAVTAAPPSAEAAAGASFFSPHTMLVLIGCKLLLIPALNFALFFLLVVSWKVPFLTSSDPVATLVVLLQAIMPTAQTLLIVASHVGNDRALKALSLLFIVLYPLATVALIPWLMVAIQWAGV